MDKHYTPEQLEKLRERRTMLGDPGIMKSLGTMYQKEGAPNIMAQYGMHFDPKVWDYMQKALMALNQNV